MENFEEIVLRKLNSIETTQQEMRKDIKNLQKEQQEMKIEQQEMKKEQQEMKTEQQGMRKDIKNLQKEQKSMRDEQKEMKKSIENLEKGRCIDSNNIAKVLEQQILMNRKLDKHITDTKIQNKEFDYRISVVEREVKIAVK